MSDFIPDPFLIDSTKLDLTSLKQTSKIFRQFRFVFPTKCIKWIIECIYSRLTATLNDSSSVHKFMHHSKLKLFDIIAVRFEDEQILTTLTRKGIFTNLIYLNIF